MRSRRELVRGFAAIAFAVALAAPAVGRASCIEWSLWAADAVPEYFRAGDADSVRMAIDDWRAACGPQPSIVRIDVLARIWAGYFDPEQLDPGFVDHLVEIELQTRRRSAADRDTVFDDVISSYRFDRFSRDLAADLVPVTAPGTVEYLLARFYAGDTEALWKRVDTEPYSSSRLGRLVREARARLGAPRPEGFLSIHLGSWSGTAGGLERAGDRVGLGARVGVRRGRLSVDLAGDFLIGEFDTEYAVFDGDAVYLTDRFTGASVVVEPGIRLVRAGPLEVDLVAGAGWAGAEALPAETVIEDGTTFEFPAVWIHAFVRTAGLDLRFEQRNRFVELQARHEWSDWNTGRGGSDLDGRAWQFRFGIGFTTGRHDTSEQRRVIEPRPGPVDASQESGR